MIVTAVATCHLPSPDEREGDLQVTVSVGDRVPDATVMTLTADGPQPVQTSDVLGTGKVVLFAVPGAFTPTCSDHHLPGFVLRAEDLRAKAVERIACVAVNDPFVLGAWGQARGTGDNILMLSDGNGEFTAAMGMQLDASGFGMGSRSQRYAGILDNGVIKELFVEPVPTQVTVSSVETVLGKL
jgi:peroxiredoxin